MLDIFVNPKTVVTNGHGGGAYKVNSETSSQVNQTAFGHFLEDINECEQMKEYARNLRNEVEHIWQKQKTKGKFFIPLRSKKVRKFEKLLGFARSHSIMTRCLVRFS